MININTNQKQTFFILSMFGVPRSWQKKKRKEKLVGSFSICNKKWRPYSEVEMKEIEDGQ